MVIRAVAEQFGHVISIVFPRGTRSFWPQFLHAVIRVEICFVSAVGFISCCLKVSASFPPAIMPCLNFVSLWLSSAEFNAVAGSTL